MRKQIAKEGDKLGNYTCIDSTYTVVGKGSSTKIVQSFKCKCGIIKQLSTRHLQYYIRLGKIPECKSCSMKKTFQEIEHVKRAFDSRRNSAKVGLISGTFFSHIKQCAKHRNIIFSVTKEYLWKLADLQNFKCAITGLNLKFTLNRVKSDHDFKNSNASLDRINSDQGYIEGNVQWIHKRINNMKYTFSNKEFISICNFITNNNGNTEPSQENDIISILEGVTHRD